jgi:hypothetical protein
LAARLDQTAYFECHKGWGEIEFPPPFGRPLLEEERYIQELDSKTGASLKLTVLNPNGRIWTMVAGGGASVVYADTLSDLGMANEVCNYGEYSGDPTESLTFEYAKTILSLMTKGEPIQGGKVTASFVNSVQPPALYSPGLFSALGLGAHHWRWYCQLHRRGGDVQGYRQGHKALPGAPQDAQGQDLRAQGWSQLPGGPPLHAGERRGHGAFLLPSITFAPTAMRSSSTQSSSSS